MSKDEMAVAIVFSLCSAPFLLLAAMFLVSHEFKKDRISKRLWRQYSVKCVARGFPSWWGYVVRKRRFGPNMFYPWN
jgi:hypothetical protein